MYIITNNFKISLYSTMTKENDRAQQSVSRLIEITHSRRAHDFVLKRGGSNSENFRKVKSAIKNLPQKESENLAGYLIEGLGQDNTTWDSDTRDFAFILLLQVPIEKLDPVLLANSYRNAVQNQMHEEQQITSVDSINALIAAGRFLTPHLVADQRTYAKVSQAWQKVDHALENHSEKQSITMELADFRNTLAMAYVNKHSSRKTVAMREFIYTHQEFSLEQVAEKLALPLDTVYRSWQWLIKNGLIKENDPRKGSKKKNNESIRSIQRQEQQANSTSVTTEELQEIIKNSLVEKFDTKEEFITRFNEALSPWEGNIAVHTPQIAKHISPHSEREQTKATSLEDILYEWKMIAPYIGHHSSFAKNMLHGWNQIGNKIENDARQGAIISEINAIRLHLGLIMLEAPIEGYIYPRSDTLFAKLTHTPEMSFSEIEEHIQHASYYVFEPKNSLPKITGRRQLVLLYELQGKNLKEIASLLNCSPKTVSTDKKFLIESGILNAPPQAETVFDATKIRASQAESNFSVAY